MATQLTLTPSRQKLNGPIVIGKDILELLSSAMYVDPLSIYREYIQNAADAIDEARDANLYSGPHQPRIEITVDPKLRSAKIRDNGIGIKHSSFIRRMTSLGASKKRGSPARGFRGVGRLSGLGYAQELIMRSKSTECEIVSEIRWDCNKFKQILRDNTFNGNLNELLHEVVSLDALDIKGYPAHFFEVEMTNVPRIKDDVLLNETKLASYLSQVGPVPFSPEFVHGRQITQTLQLHSLGQAYKIFVNGNDKPIYRPFRDSFHLSHYANDVFKDVQFVEIPAVASGIDAVGWILQHGYFGALPDNLGIKGLRIRMGNIQIGEHAIFESLFPEPRFNAWAVGEIHILPSSRLIPNGRRDNFEHNSHYLNLQNHITVIAKDIAKTCRSVSTGRNKQRRDVIMPNNSSNSTAPRAVAEFLSKKQRDIVQSLPKPQSTLCNHLLHVVYKLSPTTKTAKRIINGIIIDLNKNKKMRVAK